jgi:uncharacterized coiled-coil DUF342 family protein
MNKPKGGRGNKASYQTKIVRLPIAVATYATAMAESTRELLENNKEEDSIHYCVTEREEAINTARTILKERKGAKQSLQKLLQVLYNTDIAL